MEEQQKTNNPHDKGYKRIFKIKKNFLDFIKKYVAMDWMAELTVDDIELVDKEFITDQFETYESDFVYKIHVKNNEIYMFFLQELQSKNDFSMPFRLLVYMTAIWLDYFKNADKNERTRKDFFFPPIFPLVLYNGKNRWTAKKSFKEMIKGRELLEEYVLDFRYQLISVSDIEPEFITSSNTLVDNILYADSFMDENAWMKNASTLSKRLQALSKEDMNAWLTWFQHAVQELNTQRKEDIIEKIRNGDVDNMCNSFERVLNDVREQGREQGLEQGKRQGLIEGIIETYQEIGLSENEIIEKLQKKMSISRESIEEYMEKLSQRHNI